MEQSPKEANNHAASQEISCLLWNLKVHYHVQKSSCHWSLSWARWIQSTSSCLIYY